MIIKLYKNGKIVLEENGRLDNNEAIFGNIVYNIENLTLVRQDASYKYSLDFMNDNALVELKEYNTSLPLRIKVVNKEINSNFHRIAYNIESEEIIENTLEIIFKE